MTNIRTKFAALILALTPVLSAADVTFPIAPNGGGDSSTVRGGLQVGSVNYSNGIPFIVPSSGSVGNNGALTMTTALPLTYARGYVCLQNNVIASGVAAGCYYATCSSATLCTLFNNLYTGPAAPTVPASPTAFATTGPGAYTETTSAVTLASVSIPANSLGTNGSIRLSAEWGIPGNTNTKTVAATFGGSTVLAQAPAAGTTLSLRHQNQITNRGVTNQQFTWTSGTNGVGTAAHTQIAIDTTAAQNIAFTGQVAVATDFVILEGFTVEVLPSSP